ncbi:sensor histidine kinase [Clostridium oryzae]|uniref:histidine kinase n=1 Tax=Clostridium oryzae TaxID=1450648 RepID=A0A1V4IWF6_9CLOT|nr:HAMP domain-containing sensor histidine kinase [Clostridium oryzae]OPJ64160.1 alkaline phosphatase synthesis sensor protein PhoR [Clostridium oryzae]
MKFFLPWRRTYNRLNNMVDDAIKGTFEETDYNESELSKLEVKWKQFLTNSKLSRSNIEKEKENIKGIVSDISHQTKTPLSNILLYTQLLQEKEVNEDNKALIKQIATQAEKLDFLIHALVKISRLESGTMTIVPIKQEIAPMIYGAVTELKAKAKQKNILINVIGERAVKASCDLKWTEEAIYNIIDNAVKYSNDDTEIAISVKEFELYICIDIIDQGMGIKEEEITQIFKRFYRSQSVQQQSGVGIGLYLSREIIRQQQGYINVTSKLGKGSTFSIYLPR